MDQTAPSPPSHYTLSNVAGWNTRRDMSPRGPILRARPARAERGGELRLHFEAYKVDMPPWSDVPTEKDAENLLQRSEIKFLNQIQGPESIAFDPAGRGPYTGVADGRILFWDGESWKDFTYISGNRVTQEETL